jgi:RNA polymerase sigma factor (sigma-70 family)
MTGRSTARRSSPEPGPRPDRRPAAPTRGAGAPPPPERTGPPDTLPHPAGAREPVRAGGVLIDPAVVHAAQCGDPEAMNALLDSLEPFVAMICGPIAGTNAADATQETLLAVFRHLGCLRSPEALPGWVRVIATREAVRAARHRPSGPALDAVPDVPQCGDHELGVDIIRVLARLTPQHRAVLVLRDLFGWDESAVAAALGVPAGTVKSRLSRARSQFRREWQAR